MIDNILDVGFRPFMYLKRMHFPLIDEYGAIQRSCSVQLILILGWNRVISISISIINDACVVKIDNKPGLLLFVGRSVVVLVISGQ